MKSWQTTLTGVFGALGTILIQVKYLLDGDPATNLDPNVCYLAVTTMLGFIMARDNNKSSEDVGTK